MAIKHSVLAGFAIACGSLLCAGGTPLFAQNSSANTDASGTNTHSKMSKKVSAADLRFAKDAAMGGMMEVQLGQVATRNASSDKVKQFGQRMVDDHSKANDQLKAIAAKENINLPTSLDAKHQAMLDRLSKMNGTDFDRAYMSDMVKDHHQDIAAFHTEASTGSNADIRDFAAATLPTLQDHLRQAEETQTSLGSVSQK